MEFILATCITSALFVLALTTQVFLQNKALRKQLANLQAIIVERDLAIEREMHAVQDKFAEDVARFHEIGEEIARVGYANISTANQLLQRLVEGEEPENAENVESDEAASNQVDEPPRVDERDLFAQAEDELHSRVIAELSSMAQRGDVVIPANRLRMLSALGTVTALHSVGRVVDRVTKLHLERVDAILASDGVGEPGSDRVPKAGNKAVLGFVRGDNEADGSLASVLGGKVVEGIFDGARFTSKPENDMPPSSQRPTPPAV